jgi:hypothetical protein
MIKRIFILISIIIPLLSASVFAEDDNYDKNSIINDAADFFGEGTEGLGEVIEKIFKQHGRPNAIIKGEEASGALGIGARYGNGTLTMKKGGSTTVHWTGPSIGFDAGANASKVFVLIYHLPNAGALFQRFPAVDGSLYFIGGISANYHQSDNIILAPMRLGAGLRAGVNVGYMKYTRKKTWNPF